MQVATLGAFAIAGKLAKFAFTGARLPLGAILMRGRLAFSHNRTVLIFDTLAHPLKHVASAARGETTRAVASRVFAAEPGRRVFSAFRAAARADFFSTRTLLKNGERIAQWLKTAVPGVTEGAESAYLRVSARFSSVVGDKYTKSAAGDLLAEEAHQVTLILERTRNVAGGPRTGWQIHTVLLDP